MSNNPAPTLAPKTREAFNALLHEMTVAADRIDDLAIDEQQAAEGYQAILHALSMVADNAIDGDPLKPAFVRMDTRARKLVNSPDAEYDNAMINGDRQYRIRGNRGSVHYIGHCVYGTEGGRRIVVNLADTDIEFDKDGNYELVLSVEQPTVPGQWVQIAPDANQIQIRQYMLDRSTETLATYDIELISDEDHSHSPPYTDQAMADRFGFCALGYAFLTQLGEDYFPGSKQNPNTFYAASGASMGHLMPTPDAQYIYIWYELEADDSLLISGTPPDSRYWNVSLYNRWFECLEYLDRPVNFTKNDARLDENGQMKITVGTQRPADDSNWLDTRGHKQGHLLFRWMFTEIGTLPSVELVKNS